MKFLSKQALMAFFGLAIISSCSRPVAYFQPTPREHYNATQPEAIVAKNPDISTLVEKEQLTIPVGLSEQAAPSQQVEQAKQAMAQVEAYVRNDSKLATNKKLTHRMSQISQSLAKSDLQVRLATKSTTTKKTTLMQRIMLKQIDKKIKNHLSPEKPMAKSVMTVGLIVAIIGLILLLLSVSPPLGLLVLLVGLVLILVDLIR